MPAFIKTQKDEKIWSRAKSLAHKSYPDLSEDNEDFWKLTNSIYHKIRNVGGVRKNADDGQNIFGATIAKLRGWRSRVNPANIPELPKGGKSGHASHVCIL